MAAAHVVVGKAGGLTVTETLTAGRALVVAAAVPGNEARTEAFVVGGGAGVAASAGEVGATVASLRRSGELLAMGARARQLVPPGAADAVVDAALRLAERGRRGDRAAA
jgi:processive 1,2-diacylglycerol beta-glucosyltransferase